MSMFGSNFGRASIFSTMDAKQVGSCYDVRLWMMFAGRISEMSSCWFVGDTISAEAGMDETCLIHDMAGTIIGYFLLVIF